MPLFNLSRLGFVAALTFGATTSLVPDFARAEVPAVRKIAMVDMQRVLNETSAGRRARKELEASTKSKQEALEKRQASLESEAAKLSSLSGAELANKQEALQREYMEVQSMAATLEQDLANEHNNMLQKMYKNSQAIVATLASEGDLDLVLVRDPMTVIYVKDAYDITDTVVEQYDKKHK